MTLELDYYVSINTDDLLRWARYLDDIPKRTGPALARALNDYGEGVAKSYAQYIADKNDLSWSEVLDLIDIKEATPRRLRWEMDASAVAQQNTDWLRMWQTRDNKEFEKQTLVAVVRNSDYACDVCDQVVEEGPYTLAAIDEMVAKHANFMVEHPNWRPAPGKDRTNLVHPNCQCVTVSYAARRQVKLTFGDGSKSAPPELLSARQLGQRVAGELHVALRVETKTR